MLDDNKMVAQKVLQYIGSIPKVIEYTDNENISSIDIFIGENSPYEGVNSYSTIGLSTHSIGLKVDNKELRVEFIGACDSMHIKFANIISSCAFNIINNKFSCRPGTIYTDIINEYYPDSNMKHIFFATPFLWDSIQNIDMDDKVITWLMLVPISDEEFEFLQNNSSEDLEDLFEKNEIDIFNLDRKSVV